jgi:hypothetical protein
LLKVLAHKTQTSSLSKNKILRIFLVLSISLTSSIISSNVSLAAELTSCGAPGASIRLDPVRNPLQHATSGKQIGSEKLVGVVADAIGTTGVSVRWTRWAAGSSSITTYYIYLSSDNGTSWSCFRNYGGSFQKGALVDQGNYQVAVIANTGDTWSEAVILSVSLKSKGPTQLCIPKDYVIEASLAMTGEGAYQSYSKQYMLTLRPDRKNPITYSQSERTKIGSLRYQIEYSIDNWKTKVIYKGIFDGKIVANQSFYIRALSTKVPTKVRAIVDVSKVFVDLIYDPEAYSTNPTPGYIAKDPVPGPGYTSAGCKPLEAIFYPKAVASDPCLVDPNGPKCPVQLVPGENADPKSTIAPTPSSSSSGVKTITCVKGKLTKKVSAVKPICPQGYKKK